MTTLIPKYDQGGIGAVNRPINLKFEESISVLDFGAVGDGVTNDSANIQKAINAMEALNKSYRLIFPAGYTYLIGTPLRFTLGNVELCGGGTLYTKSSLYTSGILIPGYSSDARAGLLFWNGNYVYSGGMENQTYDSTLQSGIYIHDLKFYDDYNQSTGYTQYSTALLFGWCNNISVQNCTFSNFAGEIILGHAKNFNFSNNYFYDSSNQAISIFDYNGVASNNTCYLLGEFYEGSGNNVVISNNVGSYCGNTPGTEPTKYIISIGSGGVTIPTKCIISNNSFSNCNTTAAFQFTDQSSNTLIDLQIIGNYLDGYSKNQGFIYVLTTASDSGSLLISNNVIIENLGNPNTFGGCITVSNFFESSKSPSYYITNNQCVVTTSQKAGSVIVTVNIQNGVIRGNTIKLNGTLIPGYVVGYALANSLNTIWMSTTSANLAFGYPNLIVKDNIVNNIVCGDDTLRVSAITGTNVLDCLGRSFIEMVNTGALTVEEIKGQIGQTITISVKTGTVTFKQGALMKTSTGVDENVTAGQIYRVCLYAFTGGSSTTLLAKALGAPLTI